MKLLLFILLALPAISGASSIPTAKLYKKTDGKIHYWEIWENAEQNKLIIHFGFLGKTGEAFEIVEWDKQRRRNIYDQKIKEKKLEGYNEPEYMHQLIIQFQTNDSWGDPADLKFRNTMWDVLNECLGWTGNGAVHGGDIGSGTANLFFDAVDPDIAVTTIVTVLKARGISKPFKIALEIPAKGDDADVKVLYPQNYKGEFNY